MKERSQVEVIPDVSAAPRNDVMNMPHWKSLILVVMSKWRGLSPCKSILQSLSLSCPTLEPSVLYRTACK